MFSERFWNQLNWIFGTVLLMSVFGLLAIATSVEIKDLDLWLHMAVGKFIAENGFVPTVDILSNSVSGQFWVNHAWLFQLVINAVKSGFGLDGLIYMQGFVMLATFLFLFFATYHRNRHLLSGVMLFFVIGVFQQRFTIRPDIYSLLFFSVYLCAFKYWLRHRWSVFLLFIVQIAWVNMHGFSFIGQIFLMIMLVAEVVKRRLPLPYGWSQSGRLNDGEFHNLFAVFILSLVASFCNPQFLEGAIYPIKVVMASSGDSKIFFQYISELERPFVWSDFFNFAVQRQYKILFIVSLVSFFINRRNINLGLLAMWGIMFGVSQVAVRNLPYFSMIAYVAILWNFSQRSFESLFPIRFTDIKFKIFTEILFKILVTLWILNHAMDVAMMGYYDFDTYSRKSEFLGVSKKEFPYKAVQFLKDNNIQGNFFNDFNSGAYMLGKLYPQIKVYMDGRTELYGSQRFNRYRQIWNEGNEELFEQDVERFNLTGVLLNAHHQDIPEPVLKMMARHDDEWALVYFDFDGVIYLKRIPENQRFIRLYEIDLSRRQVIPANVDKIGAKVVRPYRFLSRAKILHVLGYDGQALLEVQQALIVEPLFVDALSLQGTLLTEQGRYEEAFHSFRLAAAYGGEKNDLMKDVMNGYYNLGKYYQAIAILEQLADRHSNAPGIWLDLARCYVKIEDSTLAKKYLSRGLELIREGGNNHLMQVAKAFQEQGLLNEVHMIYNKVLSFDPNHKEALSKVSSVLEKTGEYDHVQELINRMKTANEN